MHTGKKGIKLILQNVGNGASRAEYHFEGLLSSDSHTKLKYSVESRGEK